MCAGGEATIRPAVYLPGQIDKVTGTSIESTKEAQIKAATSQRATHAPAIAYHLKDAILFDGSIYRGRLRHLVADSSLFHSVSSEPRHLKVIGLASSYIGHRYFGHWLLDDCVQYLLAETNGTPLCLRRPHDRIGHQKQYATYFAQDWSPIDRARIDHLVVYQDFAQNTLKRTRYRILRERIRGRFRCANGRSLVYLKRGESGVRRVIQNEEEIINVLQRHGFEVASVESDSLVGLQRVLVNAQLVISIEGSHAAHCAYSVPENSGLIVLQPPDRFTAWHRDWSEAVGVRFGFVVGAVGERGYVFSSLEILRTVDLMLKRLEHG